MPLTTPGDRPPLVELTNADGFASGVHKMVRQIIDVTDVADALDLLAEASHRLGATSSCFVSYVADGSQGAAYRMLLACDPQWGSEYLNNSWFEIDPWLAYAMQAEEPTLASRLAPSNDAQRSMIACAQAHGFRSVVIAPSPSARGGSRVGALYIASDIDGYFEGDGFGDIRPLARALSMELHGWWLRTLRDEISRKARISPADLALLRHEDRGHGSKTIAAELHTEAKTIDCRFQRLNAKLGVSNRRAAVRIARLYGLI
jgi:DNA-binding NarL/FixJ family response regulator